MTSSLNTIRKQTLQFQYNGNADGFALQKEVSDWCNFTLIPEIEMQLDSLDLGDDFVNIDKIEIEATANKNDWQQKIREELISSLKQKLIDFKPKLKEEAGIRGVTKSGKLDELILYFFENGYLPWWGKALIADDFETVLQNWIREEMSPARAEFIRAELKQKASKTLFHRITNQLPPELVFQLLKNIYKQEVEMISHTESFFQEVIAGSVSAAQQKAFKEVVSQLLLTMLVENEKIDIHRMVSLLYEKIKETKTVSKLLKPASNQIVAVTNPVEIAWQQHLNKEHLKQKLQDKKQQTSVKKTETVTKKNIKEIGHTETTESKEKLQYNKLIDRITNPDSEKKIQEDMEVELQEGIYIENAGAVIFAAFLPALFKQLELEKNGTIQNPDLAAMIVQYCVTGNAKIAEYELVLPKILCSIDIELPVKTNSRITTAQMKEADEMLQSLIEYWSVLKNTSVDGLRESFLKRSGKLSLKNKQWLLQIEQRSYDMLLQQLPWSISMIKLPWMANLLVTEWV
jgi:hypothetical protein